MESQIPHAGLPKHLHIKFGIGGKGRAALMVLNYIGKSLDIGHSSHKEDQGPLLVK